LQQWRIVLLTEGFQLMFDVLRGAVWFPTLRGVVRVVGWMGLEEAAWQRHLAQLERLPGARQLDGKTPETTGWLVPLNVVKAGTRGALLSTYPAVPRSTPGGLQLHEHQCRAVSFLLACTPEDEGGIVGGKDGAGKTIIALESVLVEAQPQHPSRWPKTLIIGTMRSRSAWVGPAADPAKQYGLSVEPLESETFDQTQLARHRIVFIHYDILEAWQSPLFHIFKPEYLIFDELHHLCHPNAHRSEAARFLSECATIKKRIGLTGSPIPNRRSDLYHALAVIQPRQWGKRSDSFLQAYCGRKWVVSEGNKEYPVEDEDNVTDEAINELRARLAGVLLRFGETEVQGLPDLDIERCEITLDDSPEAKQIRLAHRDFGKYLRSTGALPDEGMTIRIGGTELRLAKRDQLGQGWRLQALSVIIGLLSEYKAKVALDLVLRALEHHHHVVVFTWRVGPAKALHQKLRELAETSGYGGLGIYGPLDGDMPQEERQKEAQAFAKDSGAAVCVATIGGAGESVNELSAASLGIAVDLHWQPHALGQMVSRLHRDGGPHSRVKFTFIVCKGTLDEELLEQFEQKVKAQKRTVPGESVGFSLVNIKEDASEVPTLDSLWATLQAIPDEE
jgi:SNF2 family DNA or RNA helicase